MKPGFRPNFLRTPKISLFPTFYQFRFPRPSFPPFPPFFFGRCSPFFLAGSKGKKGLFSLPRVSQTKGELNGEREKKISLNWTLQDAIQKTFLEISFLGRSPQSPYLSIKKPDLQFTALLKSQKMRSTTTFRLFFGGNCIHWEKEKVWKRGIQIQIFFRIFLGGN